MNTPDNYYQKRLTIAKEKYGSKRFNRKSRHKILNQVQVLRIQRVFSLSYNHLEF